LDGRSELTEKGKDQEIQKVLVDHGPKLKNKRSTAGFRLNILSLMELFSTSSHIAIMKVRLQQQGRESAVRG
jgi:hypothetical protein